MLLEKDLPKTVRRLISADEAEKLLQQYKEWQGSSSDQWKARAESNQAAIDSGEPFGYARVYKELNKLETEGQLRPRDRAHMKLALDLLTEELARSLGKTRAQARKLVTEVSPT
jgi:RNA polymerase-interacting CarD/CdnL/TRCF family regulator